MKPVIYQILTRLWPGGGKFSSFDGRSFDYMRSLGVSHVWYTGIIRHSMGRPYVKGDLGSPYSIEDYYDVNPYLADDPDARFDEFRALVRRTHEAGFKVIIDFVPNHVSPDYCDNHGGIPVCDYCDYDWTDTRKIDYAAPGAWDRMTDIVLYWASEGIDGFRCDMTELVPPEFLKYLIHNVKESYPEVIFIAEAYNRDNYWKFIREIGFDYLYDKSGMYDKLREIAAGRASAREITWNWQFLGDLQPNMLDFLENHDEQRLASEEFLGNPELATPLLYVSLLFNTAPFMLFFGQETGENGAADGNGGRTSIFSRTSLPTLEDALAGSPNPLLDRYREVLRLASESRAVQDGLTYDLCFCQNIYMSSPFDPDRHFVFLRHYGDETILVFANFSDKTACLDVEIPVSAMDYLGTPLPERYSVCVNPHDARFYRI